MKSATEGPIATRLDQLIRRVKHAIRIGRVPEKRTGKSKERVVLHIQRRRPKLAVVAGYRRMSGILRFRPVLSDSQNLY